MEKMTLEQTITALTEEKKYKTLRDVMSVMHPADLAEILNDIDNDKRTVLFRLLPKELAADVFVELYEDVRGELILGFTDKEISAVVNEMYVDDAADIVEEMPANVVKRILKNAEPQMRKMINEILKYPEDSAGSIMNTEYIALRTHMTVSEAVAHIRHTGIDKESINTMYVLDKSRKLLGVVAIRDLLFASETDTIVDIMDADAVISVNTLEDKEQVAKVFDKYDITELPVVDKENRLVGIVTVDDAIDVLQDETTEDIAKMAAITPSDKPYLKMNSLEIFKSRIPWLLLLMISATFTGIIISGFEASLGVLPILTAYIPMLMDTGGNSGSQASVTIIRSLSLEEVGFADIFKVIFKEFKVSVCCGAILGAVAFLKVLFIDRYVLGMDVSLLVAFVVSATLVVTIIIAKFVGAVLPLLAKKLGFDPAVMASPFITTIVDALSLLVYFSFATLLVLKTV